MKKGEFKKRIDWIRKQNSKLKDEETQKKVRSTLNSFTVDVEEAKKEFGEILYPSKIPTTNDLIQPVLPRIEKWFEKWFGE